MQVICQRNFNVILPANQLWNRPVNRTLFSLAVVRMWTFIVYKLSLIRITATLINSLINSVIITLIVCRTAILNVLNLFKFIHKNIPPSFDYLGYALYVDYKKGMRKWQGSEIWNEKLKFILKLSEIWNENRPFCKKCKLVYFLYQKCNFRVQNSKKCR